MRPYWSLKQIPLNQTMDKNRFLGVLLFSLSGQVVWFSFIAITEGIILPFNSDVLFGALSAFLSASVSSFLICPKIYSSKIHHKTYAYSFGYGFVITLISFFIGSFIFSIELMGGGSFDISDFLALSLFGFIYSTFMMSPGLIIGGLTGVLFLYLVNKFQEEAPITTAEV